MKRTKPIYDGNKLVTPILHQSEQSLKALAWIGRSNGQVNPGHRSKPKHKLNSFQHFDRTTQLHRIKIPT